MAAVLLALDLAWRWYNHRWKNSPFENDQAYQSSSATSNNSKDAIRNDDKRAFLQIFEVPSSRDGAPPQFNSRRLDLSTEGSALAGSKRKHSEDRTNFDSSCGGCDTARPAKKPTRIGKSSPNSTEDHASVSDSMFAAQKPIVFGPNGSGYKGKDKSHQNYAATSAMYDFRGSYTQRGRGRGGQPPDDDSDADEEDKPPRRGGPGGGRGPPNGEPAANPKKEKMLKGKGKGSKAYSEWFWACCGCKGHATMSFEINVACPGCQHIRCEHCPVESAKIRKHVEIPLPPRRPSWLSFCRYHTSQVNTCDFCIVAARYGVDCPVE